MTAPFAAVPVGAVVAGLGFAVAARAAARRSRRARSRRSPPASGDAMGFGALRKGCSLAFGSFRRSVGLSATSSQVLGVLLWLGLFVALSPLAEGVRAGDRDGRLGRDLRPALGARLPRALRGPNRKARRRAKARLASGSYGSRRARHAPALRQPPVGRDARLVRELRQADLPRLHGAGARRHQVRSCARMPRSARVRLKPDRALRAVGAAIAVAVVGGVGLASLAATPFGFFGFLIAYGVGRGAGELVLRASGRFRGTDDRRDRRGRRARRLPRALRARPAHLRRLALAAVRRDPGRARLRRRRSSPTGRRRSVAEGRRRRAARLVAGGVLGAAVVVGRRRRHSSEPGLRAFEDAPCFRETVRPTAGRVARNVDRPPIPRETAAGGRMWSEPRAADTAEVDAGDRRL